MITRWRIESEHATREDVEESIEEATQAMLRHLKVTQPQDEWELTDEKIIPVERRGEGLIYARRVFRRHDG